MHKLTLVLAWTAAAGALLMSGQTAGASTYYVAKTGSDSNPGTLTAPFLTIHGGLGAVRSGDTLYVRGGTYAESFSNGIASGSSWSAPTTVSGYPGETVILRPPSGSDRVFTFTNGSYIVLNGLIMDGANVGIDLVKITYSGSSTAHHIRISNSELMNAPGQGILLDQPGNEFINLKVHDNGASDLKHGFYIQAGNNLVEHCDVYRNGGWGVHIYSSYSPTIANDNIVRFNKVHDNARLGNRGPGVLLSNGARNKVYNNLIWNNCGGIQVYNNSVGGMLYNNTIFNNNGSTDKFGIILESGGSNTVVRNNIAFQNSGGNIINQQSGTTISNNLTSDPLFVNSASQDFHLRSGSPAIDAGMNLSAEGVAVDYDGTPRPVGAAYDIGAYEYGGTTPLPSADITPPVISAVAASAVSQTGATIGWTTNEAADTQVEFGPATAYGASTVLNSTLSTSHSAVLSGLTAGTLYHYRVKSRDAAGNLATSADAAFTTTVTAPPGPVAGCISSAGAWVNAPLPAQTGTFTAEFDAVPGLTNMDGVSGLSDAAASSFSSLAAAVRFNNAGTIDVRNGGAYAAAALIPYVAGLTYHFRLVVSVPAHTYSAYVKQGANAEQLVGGNYAFRTEQAAATTLGSVGLFASTGSEQVCAAAVTASGATADITPPVISAVASSAVSQTGATIGWNTNEAADTQVEYGPTTAYGASTILNSALSSSHSAGVSALSAGTLYHYRAKSKDAAGNLAVSGDYTLTTGAGADITAPLISAVAASAVSQTGATIGWSTNEAADTQVEYGPTTAYGASTVLNSNLATSHGAVLSGLTSGTLYHYRVKSKDAAGNLATSADATFTTSAPAPTPGCTNSAGAWANVSLPAQTGTFTAEFDAVPGTASMDGVSGLSNGAAAAFGSLAAAVRFNTAGTIDARNGGAYGAAAPIPYIAGMTYHFRFVVNVPAHTYSVYVRQGANAELLVGGGYAFRTEQAAVTTLNNAGLYASPGSLSVCAAAVTASGGTADITPPVISAVAAAGASQSGVTIGWTTNEAADTQVEYGPTTAYGASTVLNSTLSTSHSAAVTGLTAGTLYHYRVKSRDAAGNLATSPDATFGTSAPTPVVACITSAGSWANAALAPQSGTFTVEYDAVPSAANIDGAAGLSNAAAANFASLAAIVRFNNAGTIDARNGGAYAAASPIPYVGGLSYHFRLAVNIPAHTYSAYVKQGANAEQLIGGNYAFRTEQAAVATLSSLGLMASPGSQSICGVVVK